MPMTIDNVHWFLDLFDELGVKVWIDGGWALMPCWVNVLAGTMTWTSLLDGQIHAH